MSAPNDFINQFEASMTRLTDIRQGIQANIQLKEQFSNNIKTSLGQINEKLKGLAANVTQLKQTADNLQLQVNTNTSSIGDKEKQIQALQDEINKTKQDRDAAIAQVNNDKQTLEARANELQARIDQLEDQLRTITGERDTLTTERDTLRAELQGKGDQAAQHAEEIKKLTEESDARLKQLQDELTAKINECEGKIQGFEKQIVDKDAEITRLNNESAARQGDNENASRALQQQIDQLKAQNENLIQRIVQATQAINQAADDLDAISKGVPNATTQQEVNALLEEIERSLENIGRAIQGQAAAANVPPPPPPLVASQQILAPDAIVQVLDAATGSPVDVQFAKILNEVTGKSKIKGQQGQKYRDALNELHSVTNAADVPNILRRHNVGFKGNQIFGGKIKNKTKKNRKQKGGFTYKSTSRRRSISSSPKSNRRTSRRSSR